MEESNVFGFLLGIGALQGLFLGFVLWRISRDGERSNKKLAVLLVILSIALLGRFAYNSKIFQVVPQLFLLSDITMFLYGPIFYFYIRDFLFGKRVPISKQWLHLLPAILHFITIIIQLAIEPQRYLQMIDERYPFLINTWVLEEVLALVQLTIYLIICLRLTLKHQHLSRSLFSFDTKSRYLLLAIIVMFPGLILWWNNYIRYIFGYEKLSIWLGFDAAWMSITLLNFIVAYFLMAHQRLFVKVKSVVTSNQPEEKELIAHEEGKTVLLRANIIEDKLLEVMEGKKAYLDPELNLYRLAGIVGEAPHHVSRVLNVQMGKNFYDFTNGYRVDEFISRARQKEYAHLTYLGVAFEVGFNSKTTFNKAFKKCKEVTPRQYLKSKPESGSASMTA